MASPVEAPARVFVIAEAGVNHNGDPELARKLVQAAADAGADAVKFQAFRTDRLVRGDAPKAEYQKRTTGETGGQHGMLERLELSPQAFAGLADRARARGIEFMATPFDEDSADLLERLGMARFKIGSGDITHLPLLRHVARKGRPVILSTGMSALEDVQGALDAVRAAGAGDVCLLHCVSDYPTKAADANLRVMETLRERFRVPVGFSDHTEGAAVAVAAAALGAAVLEKHLTLDRSLPGPDHRASLEPAGLRDMVRAVREAAAARGDGVKRLTEGEVATARVARRSLVAAQALPAGTLLQAGHLAAKRPADGLSPMEFDRVVGRRLRVAVDRDAPITWDLLA